MSDDRRKMITAINYLCAHTACDCEPVPDSEFVLEYKRNELPNIEISIDDRTPYYRRFEKRRKP